MQDSPMYERKHRLPRESYIGRRSVAFTACVEARRKVFNDEDLMLAFVPLLGRCAGHFGCAVPVYTFMPDHIHVLMIGERSDSDLKKAIDRFKYATGWWFYRNRPELHWQKDYWDHIAREFEGWRMQARYIAANPVRAGLCEDVFGWPHTGSIGNDLSEVLSDAFW